MHRGWVSWLLVLAGWTALAVFFAASSSLAYVQIQQARFGDRLDVRMEIGDDARGACVPNLILQPLVENAIRHGLAQRVHAGRICVRASRAGDRLVLEVEDDWVGLDDSDIRLEGIGLGNTRARLQELSGDDFTVVLRDATRVALSRSYRARVEQVLGRDL